MMSPRMSVCGSSYSTRCANINNPLEKILYLQNCSRFFHQIYAIYRGGFRPCIQQIAFKYKGRSINKLQNGAIPLILKIGKIRNIRFVGNLIMKIHRNFLDDDIIIMTLSVHRPQSICVLFSPPVFYHNSQVINSIGTRKNE